MFEMVKHRLEGKSAAVLASIESRLDRIMQLWLLTVGLACAARIATSPGEIGAATLLPFLLLITAPFASMVLALRWFHDADRMPQPAIRLARVGNWINLRRDQACRHLLFGASGIMVSLLIGILLNVPVRAIEYLVAMPALPDHVPGWLGMLRLMMTFDVVLLTSLYAIAFVAALRKAPVFPRLLGTIWCIDLAMQAVIAKVVASAPGLPPIVAGQLQQLLDGNVTKVLFSAGLWLPYLLLSKRVNVTYRHRITA